jgi:serine/threonine protein kinase
MFKNMAHGEIRGKKLVTTMPELLGNMYDNAAYSLTNQPIQAVNRSYNRGVFLRFINLTQDQLIKYAVWKPADTAYVVKTITNKPYDIDAGVLFELGVRDLDHAGIVTLLSVAFFKNQADVYVDTQFTMEHAHMDLEQLIYEAANDAVMKPYTWMMMKYKTPIVFTEPELEWLCWQATSAVAYLHSKLIIHCDIKPANFLVYTMPLDQVTPEFRQWQQRDRPSTEKPMTSCKLLKLADFGLCTLSVIKPKLVDIAYTITSRPPETDGKTAGWLTPKSDVWALGDTFHYMMTLRHLIWKNPNAKQQQPADRLPYMDEMVGSEFYKRIIEPMIPDVPAERIDAAALLTRFKLVGTPNTLKYAQCYDAQSRINTLGFAELISRQAPQPNYTETTAKHLRAGITAFQDMAVVLKSLAPNPADDEALSWVMDVKWKAYSLWCTLVQRSQRTNALMPPPNTEPFKSKMMAIFGLALVMRAPIDVSPICVTINKVARSLMLRDISPKEADTAMHAMLSDLDCDMHHNTLWDLVRAAKILLKREGVGKEPRRMFTQLCNTIGNEHVPFMSAETVARACYVAMLKYYYHMDLAAHPGLAWELTRANITTTTADAQSALTRHIDSVIQQYFANKQISSPGQEIVLSLPVGYSYTPLVRTSTVTRVKDFTIRNQFGQIEWEEPVDLSDIHKNWSAVVSITAEGIYVYPDQEHRPRVGAGLNHPARLTFYNVSRTNFVPKLNTMQALRNVGATMTARTITRNVQIYNVDHF